MDSSFLEEDPESWKLNEGYCITKKIVQILPTVNDHAEKGVDLIKEFNCWHTKKEDQLQFLLKVVDQHRKEFPTSSKDTLTSGQL